MSGIKITPRAAHHYFTVLSMFVATLILAGCQPAVYLMPTPVVLHSEGINAYADKQADKGTNIVSIFYATNRLPIGLKNDRHYIIGLTDTLRLGQANIQIGEKSKPWDFLKAFSTTKERDQELKLILEQSTELGKLEADQNEDSATEETQVFIDAINRALKENNSKDITIYVHGATANFYTAAAQAAQIRHFTGYNHIVLVFSWPTAENFLYYGTDVENAIKSAPIFTRLLQFLALNTDVEKINVLAYSAGGQVASYGLSLLGENAPELSLETAKKTFKLGEIYFAAPDVDLKTYVEYLPAYLKLVNNVTIAMNPDDFVLKIASIHQGTPRVGRPNPDVAVLNDQQIQWVTKASTDGTLNVIRILPEILSDYDSGAHDFWFSHPWVSTDVLIQMLFHATPTERGLMPEYTPDLFKWWYYPQEYPDQIVDILKELARKARSSQ